MESDCGNIYKIARSAAGFTQARWAELLGISESSVRLYESGEGLPSDDVVARMAEVSGVTPLGYWHLKEKSGLANDLLPRVERLELPQAVVQMLVAIKAFMPRVDELLMIASDGIVDGRETELFAEIAEDLDEVVRAALTVKCAGGRGHG